MAKKNSRPKSCQTTKFTINFHPLEHGDWSELYFKIQVPYLLTVGNHGLVRVLEKKPALCYFLSQSIALWDGLGLGTVALALSVLALLTSLVLFNLVDDVDIV